ncbi:hypothetical protein D9M72_378100 [compost metagenome]
MLGKEAMVLVVLVEALRGQHGREYRDFGVELNPHQAADDRIGDEFMPVDATVDDKAAGDDGGVLAGLGKPLRMQRDFESPRDIVDVDEILGDAELCHFGHERVARTMDDIGMPLGMDVGNALAVGEGKAGRGCGGTLESGDRLIHGVPVRMELARIRAHETCPRGGGGIFARSLSSGLLPSASDLNRIC